MTYSRDKFPFHELSLDDRVLLAHDIWSSIETECAQMELTEQQRAELDRRLDAYNKNPCDVATWEEFKDKLGPIRARRA